MAQQQLAQSDPALDAFDGLRVWEVEAEYEDTASTFLAKFQSTVASLEPEERIRLVVYMHESGVELVEAVLSDPQAGKICALDWVYRGEEDVNSIVPLLTNNCPELASLQVNFEPHFAFDFASSVLEHPSNKIKVLEMLRDTKGDLPRFFAALGQSQVLALSLTSDGSPEFVQGLCEYLTKDLLVRLKVDMDNKQVPFKVMMSLAKGNCLAELNVWQCTFSQPTVFSNLPKSITKLKFSYCTFVDGFDWSFLANGSNLRELNFCKVRDVDGDQLGRALAVHLRAKGLDELRLCACHFANPSLAVVGVELGRIKRLDVDNLDHFPIDLIALTLQSPNSEMKELVLRYYWYTMSIDNLLVPALRHPNCSLTKLSILPRDPDDQAAAKAAEDPFRNRFALFLLLQGQQVRRVYCPLRRLPVEMFRMVGEVLM